MDPQNNYNQEPTYSPYSAVQGHNYAPTSDLTSDAAYYKQPESEGQAILFHESPSRVDRDYEDISVNAPLKETCPYLTSLWIGLVVNSIGLIHFFNVVPQFSNATSIYNVISALFTVFMLVTIIYGLVVHYRKRRENQPIFISFLQLSLGIYAVDLPLLFIFGDSTSTNIRILAILTSVAVLYTAKRL